MELEGNSNSATSAAFLRQLRARHAEPLTVIWDNSPAHRGDAIRAYLTTPGLNLHLVNLPSYSPDFNADEAIIRRRPPTGAWATAVQEQVGDFFTRVQSTRSDDVPDHAASTSGNNRQRTSRFSASPMLSLV